MINVMWFLVEMTPLRNAVKYDIFVAGVFLPLRLYR